MGIKDKVRILLTGIDWKNHFLGFLSVLIGVLIAFWLNDWNENKKLQKSINSALFNLRSEIKTNHDNALRVKEFNDKQYRFLREMYDIVDEDLNLTVDDSSVVYIYSEIFEIPVDSITNTGIEIDLFSLSDVAYHTFKEAQILSNIDFSLALILADTYNTQYKLSDLDDDIIDEAKSLDEGKKNMNNAIQTLSIANQIAEELLEDHYPASIDSISSYLAKHHFKK